MSLASLKNIHHVYLLIADIYGSGAGRVDAISSRGFFSEFWRGYICHTLYSYIKQLNVRRMLLPSNNWSRECVEIFQYSKWNAGFAGYFVHWSTSASTVWPAWSWNTCFGPCQFVYILENSRNFKLDIYMLGIKLLFCWQLVTSHTAWTSLYRIVK